MNRDDIREVVLSVLQEIAPEAEPERLRGDQPLREQLDLDSVDFLNFLVGLDRRLGVSIPDADTSQLQTLDALVEYLDARA